MLPQTFAIEIVHDVLPDLIEAIRLGATHPEAERLIVRARKVVDDSWTASTEWEVPPLSADEAAKLDAQADTQFDTLLAVAETGFRLGWWT